MNAINQRALQTLASMSSSAPWARKRRGNQFLPGIGISPGRDSVCHADRRPIIRADRRGGDRANGGSGRTVDRRRCCRRSGRPETIGLYYWNMMVSDMPVLLRLRSKRHRDQAHDHESGNRQSGHYHGRFLSHP